ncbi:hypothetical protein MBAV_000347 [Candidatus Magnetobacterium bavaricum]|uniref:Uncharacterized protein n=1 Tax=Candidatus Magnetobacterium bavaricum TaxID=29290 RepID=A0A0F3H3F5_9BACT|nr:hypothetical protein MBAV_000347 [Candidatus Magnetobacterium bavaricum]
MRLEDLNLSTGSDVPQSQGPLTTGDDILAVAGYRYRGNPAIKGSEFLAGGHVPELHGVINTCRDGILAVVGYHYGIDTL